MNQVHPEKFFKLLKWLDGRDLWPLIGQYCQDILLTGLFTLDANGYPKYNRILTGRAKKNAKTLCLVLASLYKLNVWKPAGNKGNQIYFVASDLGQANDDLSLCKKLIKVNPILEKEVRLKANHIERRDGGGQIEILPAGDAAGLHGKSYVMLALDELHTQRTYAVLEGLEMDRTRPDVQQWFASYASPYRHAGVPLNDMLKQDEAGTDPRLYVSWYAGSIEEANPSLGQPLGPTMESILDAQRGLPSWIFRRLYLNLPGAPDGAAFDPDSIEQCIKVGRKTLSPNPEIAYQAFVDMSGGGSDDSTLCIGHTSLDDTIIVDVLMNQGSRTKGKTFDPQRTVEKFADLLKQYRCHEVRGDRYAGQWPRQAFEKCDIQYRVAELNRTQLYSQLEPVLNSGRVELPDHPTLIGQLIGLLRRGEKIDHPSNEHDDFSNAVAGLVSLLAKPAYDFRLLDTQLDQETLEAWEQEQQAMSRRHLISTVGKMGVWMPGDVLVIPEHEQPDIEPSVIRGTA